MIPYITLTAYDDTLVYLKATNVLSISVGYGFFRDYIKVTINHASFHVKENPDEIMKLIKEATKDIKYV